MFGLCLTFWKLLDVVFSVFSFAVMVRVAPNSVVGNVI